MKLCSVMDDLKAVSEKYRDGLMPYEEYRNYVLTHTIRTLVEEKNFKIHDRLGKGTYGDVFSGTCPRYASKVAIKIIDSEDTSIGEKNMWPTFRHFNVLNLLEVIEVPKMDIFVTPLMSMDLFKIMHEDVVTKDPSGLNFVKSWLNDVIDGLNYLHSRNLCHLDLKANNVLIDFNMNALLGDFSFTEESGQVTSYGLCNAYRPPEVCPSLGQEVSVDSTKFDIWSFGVLAVNVLTQFLVLEDVKHGVKNWRRDVFPLLNKNLRPIKFLFLMKTAFPSSNITLKIAMKALHFTHFILESRPEDRPSLRQINDHPFLEICDDPDEAAVRLVEGDISGSHMLSNSFQIVPDKSRNSNSPSSLPNSSSQQSVFYRFKRKKNFLAYERQRKKAKTVNSYNKTIMLSHLKNAGPSSDNTNRQKMRGAQDCDSLLCDESLSEKTKCGLRNARSASTGNFSEQRHTLSHSNSDPCKKSYSGTVAIAVNYKSENESSPASYNELKNLKKNAFSVPSLHDMLDDSASALEQIIKTACDESAICSSNKDHDEVSDLDAKYNKDGKDDFMYFKEENDVCDSIKLHINMDCFEYTLN